MKKQVLFAAVLLSALSGCHSPARDAAETVDNEHMFVPTAVSYMDGDFVALAQVSEPEGSIHSCLSKLQHMIGAAEENGEVPHGGSVVGACVPVKVHYQTGG